MIEIVVSILAIIFILGVIVFLITQKMKDDNKKKQALDAVINDVNKVNIAIDERQDEAVARLNAIDKTISDLGYTFAKKNDLRAKVSSDIGEFNSLKVKSQPISSLDNTLSLGDGTTTVKVDGNLLSSRGLITTFGGSNVHVINFDNSSININKDDKFPGGTLLGSKASVGNATNMWNMSVDANATATGGNLVVGASPSTSYTFQKDGVLQAPGIKVKAAKSSSANAQPTGAPTAVFTEFPTADGTMNRVRGDTVFDGNLISLGPVQFDTTVPASPGSRYGIGKFNDSHVRVFSASSAPSSAVSLSTAKGDGTFEDHMTVSSNGTVRVRGGKVRIENSGDMISDGSITAAKLVSPSLCSGTQCLTQTDITNVKNVLPLVTTVNGTTTVSGNLNAGGTICAANQCLTADDIQRLRGMIVR